MFFTTYLYLSNYSPLIISYFVFTQYPHKSQIKKLYTGNPEIEPQITKYMEQIEEGFVELRFEEPTNIPDVFLKEFENLL